MDIIIAAKQLMIERTRLIVELCENDRGRYLRITEFAHGHRNAIIVPSPGLPEFTAALEEVLGHSGESTAPDA